MPRTLSEGPRAWSAGTAGDEHRSPAGRRSRRRSLDNWRGAALDERSVAKHDIVRAGHPVLRGVAEEVTAEELGQKPLLALVRTMVEAMRRAPGVGLAAPQLGVAKRVIVLEDAERLMANLPPEQRAERGRVPFALKTIVNPTLELE